MKYLIKVLPIALFTSMVHASGSLNDAPASASQALLSLQKSWAHANYELSDKEQIKSFEQLLIDADKVITTHPGNPELLIWRGIIKSSFAGVKGGLGALSYVNQSKDDLEEALIINPEALNGSAFTSLGTLYFKVPGWPISFGDDDKAEEFLLKALQLNPDGIDPNYFYGQFLLEEDRYDESKSYLLKALNAKPREGRELADAGRKKEIQSALDQLKEAID